MCDVSWGKWNNWGEVHSVFRPDWGCHKDVLTRPQKKIETQSMNSKQVQTRYLFFSYHPRSPYW
jgi:hypothetical protein